MEIHLCERVNHLRHSLFYFLNCLITTTSELKEIIKSHREQGLDDREGDELVKIACDKDGVVDWCIVLVEIPLTRFEECWLFPTESLPELP